MSKHTTPLEKPLVIELVGLAGVGKTTLLSNLIQRHPKIISELHISLNRHLFYLIKHTLIFLPRYLRSYRNTRWFNASENRSMVYLSCWLQILKDPSFGNNKMLILDHGPIFRLTLLHEFGPAFTQSKFYIQWWEKMLESWVKKLDYVIWLDAKDDLLLNRIQNRPRFHSIKGKTNQEKIAFLSRYRKTYQQILNKFSDKGGIRLLSFDTENQSAEQISAEVLKVLTRE